MKMRTDQTVAILSEITRYGSELSERFGQIFHAIDDQVNDIILSLQDSMSDHGRSLSSDRSKSFPNVNVNDKVRGSCLIFECHEGDSVGGRRSLTQQDQSGDSITAFGLKQHQIDRTDDSTLLELLAKKTDRMCSK